MVNQDSTNGSDWQSLSEYREEIDSIDKQLLSLLSRRQAVAVEIGNLKTRLGMEVIDPAREQEVLSRLVSESQGHLSAQAIRTIFSEIISASRSVQQIPAIAYLGPEATFSHYAAVSFYGHSASFRSAESIDEVFGLVEKGLCHQGVVPIENSYEGSVSSTLDLFNKYELKISAEVFLRVRHHLLSTAENMEIIRRLYSHPMGIAQCRIWLRTHLAKVQFTEVGSTALAAQMAADDPEAAAVGSRLAGITYGLNVLAENIEDMPDNVTRFLVIGKNRTAPTGKDKTSILFFVKHEPGALHTALGALKGKNINMTRIESRPVKTKNWEYFFLVDIEGHEQDGNVSEALREMGEQCVSMKRLGSYPVGGDPWD
jgi:chorismate mutase/prephenate dehydratase